MTTLPTKLLSDILAKRCPSLGRYKRVASAIWQSQSKMRFTYSQHGEDRFVFERLKHLRLRGGMYIDVGANHPMTFSNTYLFYRNGMHGIAIEPITELAILHRYFRSRDITLCAACGAYPDISEFTVSKAPVLSTLSELSRDKTWRKELVPVVTVDLIVNACDPAWIYFLSVDTEGHDLQVLEGATNSLERILYACVEANDDDKELELKQFMVQRGFRLIAKLGCNQIFSNERTMSTRRFRKFWRF